MIDFDDAGDSLMLALWCDGWGILFFLVVAVILYFVASGNAEECSKISCPDGGSAQLMENACYCAKKMKD